VRVFRVSCATGEGIDELKRALFELCPPQQSQEPSQDGLVDFLVYRPRSSGRRFRILVRTGASGSRARCQRTRKSSQLH